MAYLDEHGPLDEEGRPRPATNLLDRLEARASSLRSDLALTPYSLARLLAAVKVAEHDPEGLEQLRAEGQKIIEARAPHALPTAPEADEHKADAAENDSL